MHDPNNDRRDATKPRTGTECVALGVWATITDIVSDFAHSKCPNRDERLRLEAIACIDAYLHDPCRCADCVAAGEIARLERHRAELAEWLP